MVETDSRDRGSLKMDVHLNGIKNVRKIMERMVAKEKLPDKMRNVLTATIKNCLSYEEHHDPTKIAQDLANVAYDVAMIKALMHVYRIQGIVIDLNELETELETASCPPFMVIYYKIFVLRRQYEFLFGLVDIRDRNQDNGEFYLYVANNSAVLYELIARDGSESYDLVEEAKRALLE